MPACIAASVHQQQHGRDQDQQTRDPEYPIPCPSATGNAIGLRRRRPCDHSCRTAIRRDRRVQRCRWQGKRPHVNCRGWQSPVHGLGLCLGRRPPAKLTGLLNRSWRFQDRSVSLIGQRGRWRTVSGWSRSRGERWRWNRHGGHCQLATLGTDDLVEQPLGFYLERRAAMRALKYLCRHPYGACRYVFLISVA